jgi:hypothetical protein
MMHEKPLKTPVLFIPYDRPEIASQVFNQIKSVRPEKLYIYIDGLSEKRKNERRINQTKDLTQSVDWDCQLNTNFQDHNLGAARAVADAITWVFENEEEAIILEEDTFPAEAFFYYCAELLARYRDDIRILSITGSNFNDSLSANDDSYFFSKYASIWGWATWRRVWQQYDFEMRKWPLFEQGNYVFDDLMSPEESQFAYNFYKNYYHKKDYHTWDAQLGFISWSNRCLGAVPNTNLVKNIGYVGEHSSKKLWFHNLSIENSYVIEKHPDFILANVNYDRWYFKKFRKTSFSIIKFSKKLVRKLLRIILK